MSKINVVKYLITADDYGMCQEVNEAIEALANAGILSTTNVMMNFKSDFKDSPLKKMQHFSIGIHWNVTTGCPVTPTNLIPSLVNKDGCFYSVKEFRLRCKRKQINKKELELELQNQLNIFIKEFGAPSYWNTHENSCLFPNIFSTFENVALRNGIIGTRNFQRVYIDYDLCKGIKRKIRELIVRTYINIKFGVFEKKKFIMPASRIVSFDNSSKSDFYRWQKVTKDIKKESVEVIIHPATSGNNPLFGSITVDRVNEYKLFLSKELKELFMNYNAEIVTFEDL